VSDKPLDRNILEDFLAVLRELDSLKTKVPERCSWITESIERARFELTITMVSVDSVTRHQRIE
jgi:hypothetical protein